MHKITIRKREGVPSNRILTGATTDILLDGQPLKGCTGFKFEVEARGIAKVTISMFADVDIDTEAKITKRKVKKANQLIGKFENE